MDTITKAHLARLLTASRKGEPEAQWELAYHYENGASDKAGKVVLEREPLTALHWYTLSAEQGYLASQCALALLLSNGGEVEPDYKAAISWSKAAIQQGSELAAFNLGCIYRDLDKPKRAFRCFTKAAEMGDRDALLTVALCYLFGFGIKRSEKKAYTLLQAIVTGDLSKMCERTLENTFYWIGVLHLLGQGKNGKSIDKARYVLEFANKNYDHEQANDLLNLIGKTEFRASRDKENKD